MLYQGINKWRDIIIVVRKRLKKLLVNGLYNFNRRLLDFGWEAAISSIKIYADHILPTIVETRVLKFIDI
jgi:hypothetical protein